YETNTKQAAIEVAEHSYLLMDSSKFDKICPVAFANLEDFDTIITDENLSHDWIKFIDRLGIELILV
ncbi:MAG: DeoR/GlpR transcriptional regulator, partial [Clostridium sp.]|nr:DeoR/GlpR transcriptional regulator [Clostridium sp.]